MVPPEERGLTDFECPYCGDTGQILWRLRRDDRHGPVVHNELRPCRCCWKDEEVSSTDGK